MAAIRIIGQSKARLLLELLAASRSNILAVGPPGHGKTTLAKFYLARFGKPMVVAGRIKTERLEEILKTTQDPMLIDEAHKLIVPETIYESLDAHRRVFALATTDQGLLPGPLQSRLFLVALEPYTTAELAVIAAQTAPRLSADVLWEIALYARGSPRRAEMLAKLLGSSRIRGTTSAVLTALGYEGGLNAQERAMIQMLATGPKSLHTLSGFLGVGPETVRSIESDLLANGIIEITSRGRKLATI
jgi:Holliday junction resolvasome RuvABC ATP-dependent DNA helicase subunit